VSPHLLVLLAPSVTVLLRFWETDLRRDEVLYAAVAKGIGVHRDWLNLYIGDDPYWNKPPLSFWLAAAAYRVFGLSTFSARLFTVLFTVLSCLALYLLARRLFGQRTALLSALVFATTPRIIGTGTTFNHDSPVIFFTLVSTVLYVRCAARPDFRDALLAGASWGLAVMTKGAFGLLGPFVLVVYAGVHGRWRLLTSGPILASVAVAAAVCLPWHVYQVAHWGTPFLSNYLGREIVERMAGRLWPDQRMDSYAMELIRDDWPWIAFTLVGAAVALARGRRGDRDALFALAWAAGYFLLLHLSTFQRGQYLMHLYPPAAILAALALERFLPERWLAAVPRTAAVALAATAVVLALLPFPIHGKMAPEVKALRPVLDRLMAPAEPLVGFRTNIHLRAASLVYLDRDVHDAELPEILETAPTLVVSELQAVPKLRAAGLVPVDANARYALFRPPSAAARSEPVARQEANPR
jgi:4-amino-4-deoxy-L-arabinose transferase-like glycosyltransferase